MWGRKERNTIYEAQESSLGVDPHLLKALKPYFTEVNEGIITHIKRQRQLARFRKERIPGKDTTALVIGRFQPPHPGHFYLLEAALQVADNVIIGIGSANKIDNDNPFLAELREYMLHTGLKVRGIEKHFSFAYLNDYDEDLDDYDKDQLWCDRTLAVTGIPDVVVGNNPWVNNIFRSNNIRVLEIKELRRAEYQGSVIRNDLRSSGIL